MMKKTLISLVLAVLLLFGSVICTKAFYSTADFSYREFEPVDGRVIVTFDITVNTVSDGVIGIASPDINLSAYSDYAVCFRIREGGYFDTVNGPSSWGYDNKVSYTAGKTYKIILDCDTNSQVYSAFAEEDGVRKTIAENYAFRRSAESLSRITARNGGSYPGGLYEISNILFTKGEGEIETFRLPNFYAENMVFQRGRAHVIYGKSNAEYVDVSLSGGGKESKVRAIPKNGEFKAYLSELPASLTPYTLTVSSKDKTEVIENVFIGDVFILAGQSNMAQNYEFQTTEQMGAGVNMSNLPERVSDSRIKHFTMERKASSAPTFDVPCKTEPWQELSEANNKTLSYIGQFFARERLKEEPNVPIGLISAAWNGTTINRWMRKSDENKTLNYTPSNGDIFNSHIAPLVGFPFKAMLWYQGESDSSEPVMYGEAFPRMIEDYRELWNEKFPFLFVQLSRYSGKDYAPQRQAQLKALELENVGMAVILDTDMGTYANLHPLGKEEIARRLSLLADKLAYGKNVVSSGPIFERAEIGDGEIIVHFKPETAGDGLVMKNTYSDTANELCEFEIAAENGEFVPAKAVIESDNTIRVFSEDIENPKYVRYAYSAVPENPNLFNKNGLPASPFNTDTRIWSADSFMSRAYEAEVEDMHASFSAAAMKDGIDAVIGFSAAENNISSWSHCGAVIRFGKEGYIEYYDGDGYKKSPVSYSAGEKFEFDVFFDFAKKSYTVTANKRLICCGASFREGSLAMNDAGRLMVRGGDKAPAGELFAEDYVIEDSGETIFEANDGEKKVFIKKASDADFYAAVYDGLTLIKAERAKAGAGISVVRLPEGEKYKAFLWDGELSPKK